MLYKIVEGPCHIGLAQKVELNAAQIRRRVHNLDVKGPMPKGDGRAVCTPKVPIMFKTGEVIGIGGDLSRDQLARCIKVDKDGNPVADKKAAGKGGKKDAGEGAGADAVAGEGAGAGSGQGGLNV